MAGVSPSRKPGYTREGCQVCARLTPVQLLEFDQVVGDPASWPSTIFGMIGQPEGGLPATYRRWGAERVGREWLDSNGYSDIGKMPLKRHIRYDVAHIARDPMELVELGIIAKAKGRRLPTSPTLDAGQFITYFNSGIQVGIASHQLIVDRINKLLDDDKEVPIRLLEKLADMGAAFAKTQAQLMARGVRFEADPHEDESFMGSDDERPSARIGHARIRTVEGERRPIADEGPKDRDAVNKRQLERGGDPI